MLEKFKNSLGYKGYVIYFITFDFGEGVKIIEWLINTKAYVFTL